MKQDKISPKKYKVIGLMSGTSLDGLDISYCQYFKINQEQLWKYQLTAAKTYQYQKKVTQLIKAMENINLPFLQFHQAEIQYTIYVCQKVQQFLVESKISIQQVDFIATHGHTIFHQPKSKKLTKQITNLNLMAANLHCDVIGNFRQLDIFRGGQGAPLAPYAQQLFQNNSKQNSQSIFCNLGGVTNIGYHNNGIDVFFCNMLLNWLSQKISNKPYDEDGQIGKSGKLNLEFQEIINQKIDYKFGKSLAREDFETLIALIIPIIECQQQNKQQLMKNILCTSYHIISKKIIKKIIEIIEKESTQSLAIPDQVSIILTGGGAHNSFLVSCIKQYAQKEAQKIKMNIILPEKSVIDFKEAILFGLLGVKFMERERNCSTGTGGMLVKGKQ